MKDNNFSITIKILNELRLNYWVCHGTLLGIIRDKKLLSWDNDIDVAVLKNESSKKDIIKKFLMNGFKRKKKYFPDDGLMTFTKKGGREVDINFYEPFLKNKNKFVIAQWYIPKNFFFKIIDAASNSSNYEGKFKIIIKKLRLLEKVFLKIKIYLIKKKLFYSKIGYAHPISFIQKKKKLKYKNLTILIPKNSERYLEYIYGKNWRIPKKKYVWHYDSPSLDSKP